MRPFLLLLSATVLSSCVPGTYQRDFKQAAASLPAVPANPEGPWQGRWKSEVNGHEGPLWCIVSPTPERAGHYDFRYRAGWGAIHFGDYTHTIPAVAKNDGSLAMEGDMELPAGFGTHSVSGTLTPTAFDATYRSERGDKGVMTLRRP